MWERKGEMPLDSQSGNCQSDTEEAGKEGIQNERKVRASRQNTDEKKLVKLSCKC